MSTFTFCVFTFLNKNKFGSVLLFSLPNIKRLKRLTLISVIMPAEAGKLHFRASRYENQDTINILMRLYQTTARRFES